MSEARGEGWRLVRGDCLDVLRGMPDASVDAVVTDPPYPCIRRSYGYWTEAEWWALMRPVVAECRRVLKPQGSAVFVLQPNSERVGRMRTWLWEFMAWVGREWGVVQDAYWWNHAALPTVHCHRDIGLMRPAVKTMVWAGAPDCYRDQNAVLWASGLQQTGPAKESFALRYRPSGYAMRNARLNAVALERGGSTPHNLLPMTHDDGKSPKAAKHGALTPHRLCSWLVRYICPPGGTVLDPFAGSGTVPLAALKLGRRAVGIERVPEYFDVARRRLEEASRAARKEVAAA